MASEPAPWFVKLCEGERRWHQENAQGERTNAKADKPKGYEPGRSLHKFVWRRWTFAVDIPVQLTLFVVAILSLNFNSLRNN